jgi:hypothetical protein
MKLEIQTPFNPVALKPGKHKKRPLALQIALCQWRAGGYLAPCTAEVKLPHAKAISRGIRYLELGLWARLLAKKDVLVSSTAVTNASINGDGIKRDLKLLIRE